MQNSYKDVLITGTRGFIGSHIPWGTPFRDNIMDYDALLEQTENMVGIVHLAAKGRQVICEEDPKKCIESNLVGLCNVLEIALQKKLWVIFASTFQVKSRQIYGLSKLMGEELCRLYHKKGLKVKIIRLPVIYGPDDKPTKIVTKFINQLKLGIEPKVNTKEKFYFLYISDAVKVIENQVAILKEEFGEAYSLTGLIEGIKKCLKEEKK